MNDVFQPAGHCNFLMKYPPHTLLKKLHIPHHRHGKRNHYDEKADEHLRRQNDEEGQRRDHWQYETKRRHQPRPPTRPGRIAP